MRIVCNTTYMRILCKMATIRLSIFKSIFEALPPIHYVKPKPSFQENARSADSRSPGSSYEQASAPGLVEACTGAARDPAA